MQQVANTGVFENLKEKISNPVMFTYFWIFCTFNHKSILLLFNEPKLFSEKMAFLYQLGTFGYPALITIAALLILPWLNSITELWKSSANNWLEEKLKKYGWSTKVDNSVYQEALDEISQLKNTNSTLSTENRDLQQKHTDEKDKNYQLLQDINDQKKELDKTQKDLSDEKDQNQKLQETIDEQRLTLDTMTKELEKLKSTPKVEPINEKTPNQFSAAKPENTQASDSIFKEVQVNDLKLNNIIKDEVQPDAIYLPLNTDNQVSLTLSRNLNDNETVVAFDGSAEHQLNEDNLQFPFFFEKKQGESIRLMLRTKSKNPNTPNKWIEDEFAQFRVKESR